MRSGTRWFLRSERSERLEGLPRDFWLRRIEQLDPAADNGRIYGIIARHEFPWDLNQSLSFALFRTYAVPSIGVLLHRTGEFTQRTQKRYDDTTLLLDAIGEHGLDSAEGRAALRRMNQMHTRCTTSATTIYGTCSRRSSSCRSAGSTNTGGDH